MAKEQVRQKAKWQYSTDNQGSNLQKHQNMNLFSGKRAYNMLLILHMIRQDKSKAESKCYKFKLTA